MVDLPEEEKKKILEAVDFVQALSAKISPPREEPVKGFWKVFLESTGGAALITVLLGGIFGNVIACTIGEKNKDREFQQAWLQARGNQAMVAYKEYLDSEQGLVTDAYDTIGTLVSSADNLISITGPEFELSLYEGKERDRVSNQQVQVRNDFNTRLEKFQSRHGTLGFLMDFYHPRSAGVNEAWNAATAATFAFCGCANRRYVEVTFPKSKQKAAPAGSAAPCDKERTAVLAKMEALGKMMNSARRYAWEGWESPETLRAALERRPSP